MKTPSDIIRHFFTPYYMLSASQRQGDMPDYNTKSIYKILFNVAWPAALESLLISLIGFIDSVMVSSVGTEAIAAVGLTNQPRFIFFAIFFALNVGVTAIVSRRCGEKNYKGANECLAQTLGLVVILGIILGIVAIVFSEPLMIFAGAKEDTVDMAVVYFNITMVGTVFTSIGMVINAAQRGCGNTKISMRTNLTANVINVIFNFFLINGYLFFPKLGVTGAAIATLMGNVVSFGMSVFSISHPDKILHLNLKDIFVIYPPYLKLLFIISSSALVEQVFMRIGFFSYAKMVAELGTTEYATHQICMNIINLSFAAGDGLGIAASSLVGQNLGKNRPDYSIIYGKCAQRVGLIFSMMLFSLFMFGGGPIMWLFTEDVYIISTGINILRIVAFTSPLQIFQVIFSGCLRGAGDTKFVMISSIITIAIIRPIITYILCYPLGLGIYGAWISLMLDQYMRFFIMWRRFAGGKWCKIKI